MLKKFLVSRVSKKNLYIWNTLATALNSGQTFIILFFISQLGNHTDAGVFTIAYALANLAIMIGRYGVRQYQVSDIEQKYSFFKYFKLRLISSFFMLIFCLCYILYRLQVQQYTPYKAIIVALICFVRLIDVIEDVFHGYFQRHKRLELAAKIQVIRYTIYMVSYIFIYIITKDLLWSTTIALIADLIAAVLLNFVACQDFGLVWKSENNLPLSQLLIDCFPLFLTTFFSTYLGNAPRYTIDSMLSDELQADFGYIFMPIFVITLGSLFIYQPMIRDYAKVWTNFRFDIMRKMIIKQVAFLSVLMVIGMICAFFAGIPILSLVFNAELNEYKYSLLLLLWGGFALALVNFFTMIITVIRIQKYAAGGYIVCSILFLVLGSKAVEKAGIIGISILYAVLMTMLMIFCVLITILGIRRGGAYGKKEYTNA